jgi:hypothetical protein
MIEVFVFFVVPALLGAWVGNYIADIWYEQMHGQYDLKTGERKWKK